MRQRENDRGVDPEVLADLPHALEETEQLPPDLLEVPPAGELWCPGRDGVEPEHAIPLGNLHHHVVVAGGVFVPVLRKADDVLADHFKLPWRCRDPST